MEKHVKGTGKHYDYLLVGGGLFNGIIAHEAGKQGKSCLVVEKRSVLGGNIHCREVEESWSMSTGRIFSTRAAGRSGTM